LIAELKRARKLEVAEEQPNKNLPGVNATTLSEKDEVNQDDDEGKEKSGTKEPKEKTNKEEEEEEEEEEEGDECPICLENLPKDATKFTRFICCGKGIHGHCNKDRKSMGMGKNCPMCRAKTPSSPEEVVKYLRPWVKKKKAWAMAQMAQMYRNGTGVKQSYEMARVLYEQAAQQGYVSAMVNLGILYEHVEGVEQSYEKAFEYYEQAAQQGDVSAMVNLGVLYENGLGVEQSYERALQYYEQAAQLGYAKAQFNLGCCYANGEGVEQNMAAAKEWAEKSAAQGHEKAIAILKSLKN
jgi:hypothetical protein